MRILFVFVFLLGLVSCDNRKDAPKCEEIKGINGFASIKGNFSLPKDLGDAHTRSYYPAYKKKHKNYTGIIKVCKNDKVYLYANYVNGKLNGKSFCYDVGRNGMFKDVDFNLFKLFRKPKLIRIDTYKNAEIQSSIQFNHFNGKKTREDIYAEKRKQIIREYYDNGKLGFEQIISNNNEGRQVSNTYWDKNGKKTSDWPGISHTKKNIFDFIGLTITPFFLFLLFILYRRRKKRK